MRDLAPALPALVLPSIGGSAPAESMVAMQARAAALVAIVNDTSGAVPEAAQDAAHEALSTLRPMAEGGQAHG